jgi:UDP-glucose 4-epimerase
VKVVVTGATGFIGNRVRQLLSEQGHAVTAIARSAGRSLDPAVNWMVCDLADPGFVDGLPETADAVIHLAQAGGSPPDESVLGAVNVASTRRLLEYSRRCGATRFILASSGSVYGGSPTPLREAEPPRPPDAYARSKADAEALLEQAPSDVSVCALRLFAPYGPGQNGRLVADLVGRVSSGRPVTLYGGGHPRLNPIYVADVAAIFVQALETPVPPFLNVAGDEVLSIRDMAEAAGRALEISPVFEEAAGVPPPDLVADTTLLRQSFDLGKLTPFERGIAATVGFGSDA